MLQTVEVNTEPLKWPIAPDGYIPNSVIRSWRRKGKEVNMMPCWSDIFHSLPQADEQEDPDQPKTADDGKLNVVPQEVSPTYSSRKTVNFPPTSCLENGPKPLKELSEDMKLPETITPPLQYPSVPSKPTTFSFIQKEQRDPPVESPVVSAVTLIPKQEPRITSCIPPTEPKSLTPQTLKAPPPSPDDPQPQLNLGPFECLPIEDKRLLLSSTKYSNITAQEHVPLDRKVFELYRKLKFGKKISHLGKVSTRAERLLASKAAHATFQTNTGRVNLNSCLGKSPELRATLSTVQTQPQMIINPEDPSHSFGSNYPAEFAQTVLPIKDHKSHKSMPEWRRNLYSIFSLHGFRSPWAARLFATEHPVKSSNARQFVATIPSLQPGQAAAHQRVVQKIQMKDHLEPDPCYFQYVIPMPSQHNFYTLNPCGKTQYGRLQFDWMRGSEDRLQVSAAKFKDTAKLLIKADSNHLSRPA
ncbi:uncharacterized protein LOC127361991 [Dicentrarchus labrax]|uniref:uncharacterized protein LOC127361991 n=1 Tax=Dicentrarchus labrax TaxID=13489 RepID=UPI0021F65165|nr:uncharacterized protein LOC127361991 [Dicentrarchus labrax]